MRMQRKIFLSFLLVIALPTLAFCLILLKINGDLIEKRTLDASVIVIQESIKRIETRLEEYHRMTMQIYFNSQLMNALEQEMDKPRPDEELVSYCREILKSFVNSDKHLVTANIRTSNMDITEGAGIITLEQVIEEYDEELNKFPGRLIWVPTTAMSTVFGQDDLYFAATRLLRQSNKTIGRITLVVREAFFHDKEAGELPLRGSRDYIVTAEGLVISSSQTKLTGSPLQKTFFQSILKDDSGCFISDDGQSYVVHQTSRLTGWTFIRILEKDAVLVHFDSMKDSLFILFGLFILFILTLSYLLSTGLVKPLAALVRQIDYFGEGNLKISHTFSESSTSEIDSLYNSMKAMTGRITTLLEKVTEEEKLKTKAELKALRSQLNPHFIYNTLNTIRWMAAVNSQSNIEETAIALITLMRSASDMERTLIPVEEEISNIRQYILIQKNRYHDFTLNLEIPPEVNKARINKFIIQPLIENSIIHGIRDREIPGIITLKIYKRESEDSEASLEITVIDNGRGFNLSEIRKNQEENRESVIHTGIRNIQKRLELNYGRSTQFSIESSPGQGTRVQFTIPWITKEQDLCTMS